MNSMQELLKAFKESLEELRDTKFALTSLLEALSQQRSLDHSRLASDFETAFIEKRRGEEDAMERALYFIEHLAKARGHGSAPGSP
jgi:hypothetical protein